MKISKSIQLHRLNKSKSTISQQWLIVLGSCTTPVTAITTKSKGMKVKISENISENLCCTTDNLPFVCRLSKGHISNILGTHVIKTYKACCGDNELNKKQYLHHGTTASTSTTTTINSTPAATTVTTGAKNTTDKSKGIKLKSFGNILTFLK